MRKKLLTLFMALSTGSLVWGQGFTTNNTNGNLLDACGNNFIMKGMNVPLAWYVNDVNGSIDDLKANTKSNCLRIVVDQTSSDASWQTTVTNCINNKIIPMVELHDVTGSTDPAALRRMGQFWAARASYFNQPNIKKHILINLANEWGTWQTATNKNTVWRDAVINAIKPMRDAGITTTIVVDAVGYGQDIDEAWNIRTYAKDIQRADNASLGGPSNSTQKSNLLFSIHMYCEWRKGGDNIGIINTIKSSGIPIIVGEFGYQHASDGSCDIDEQAILNTCQSGGIGWLAWSQKGNGSPVQYLDLCTDWACTRLSNWGNTIINGTNGTKTAVECSVFSSTSCTTTNNPTPTVTLSAPANNSSVCVGTAVTLNATASISSGSVSKVDFYDGTTLLGTDNSSPYSYTWNNPSAGVHSLRAIATSALNVASAASTTSLTVASPTTIAPQMQINGGAWGPQTSATLCEGAQIGVGPHPVEATGWTWTGPNNFTANVREIQFAKISAAQGGEYTALYKDANGCSSSATVTVTVNPKPTTTITSPANNSLLVGNNLTINANVVGTGISSVQFYNGTTLLGQDATSPYSYAWSNVSDGTYTVYAKATTNANCSDTATTTFTVSQTTALEEGTGANGIVFYPNPFTSELTIKAPNHFHYVICDLSGVELEKGAGQMVASVGKRLPSGLYLIKIDTGDKSLLLKVAKQ